MPNPTEQTTGPEIQPTDPEFRKIVVLSLVIVCSAAVIGLVLLDDHLQELQIMALSDAAAAALALQRAARWLFLAIAGGAVLAAVYLVTLASRILRSKRYPPEGARVIRDIRVARGPAAQWRAILCLVLAALFLTAGALIPRTAEEALNKVLRTVMEIQPTASES